MPDNDTKPSIEHDLTAPGVHDDSASLRAPEDSRASTGEQRVACVGMQLGRYTLTGELGEGGMATVFSARDTKLKREVAVKVLFPHLAKRKEAASRFKREARAAAGLDHEHILRVFDVGGGELEEGVLVPPYIVLERIDGSDLGVFFEKQAAPMAELVAAIGVAMCSALEVAHEKGIVHRDIKPANIMVSTAGRLVLADFGVARMGGDDSVVTKTGALLGTPAFMSPEQAGGDPVDSRSDLYSLGATLYKVATSSLPYGGGTAQVMAAIIAGDRVSADRLVPQLGRELSRVIDKLMQGDVEKRYATATEAKKALLEIVVGGGFSDSEKLLKDYFSDPGKTQRKMRPIAIRANLLRAADLARKGRSLVALSIGERVLAMDSDNIQARALVRGLSQGKKPRVWVAVFGPMIATGAVAAVFWGYSPGEEPPLYVGDEDAGVFDASSEHAAPLLDAGVVIPKAAVPDAAVNKADAKKNRIRPLGKTPTIDAAVEIAPLPPRPVDAGLAAIPPAVAKASLIVDIRPWCDVWIDGKPVGRASAKTRHTVNAGSHLVECKQQSTGLAWSQKIDVRASESRKLTGSVLPKVTLWVRLSKGDRIVLDGKSISNGAKRSIKAGRHRIEVFAGQSAIGGPEYLDIRKECFLRNPSALACFGK